MKHIKTFESFLKEAKKPYNAIAMELVKIAISAINSKDKFELSQEMSTAEEVESELELLEFYEMLTEIVADKISYEVRQFKEQATAVLKANGFRVDESLVNESMETLTGDPHEHTSALKKNIKEYKEIITKEIAKKFKLDDSLFKAEFFFQIEESMNETTAIITLVNSGGNREKEKLAHEIADYINKFVEKDSRIKKIENSVGYSGKIAAPYQKDNDKYGNWLISWRPKFFIRKTN
jgi:hypothetical protein